MRIRGAGKDRADHKEVMMYGYNGRSLEIDLTRGKSKIRKIPEELLFQTLGGRGFGIHRLYTTTGPDVDPLSPENPMILATGPLCGTAAPSTGLFSLTTRSPLTGTCLASHSGGYFGAKLKYAGFDAMTIAGAAEEPRYILVAHGESRVLPAGDLWGLDAAETINRLRARHGDVSVLAIGQAGENRSLISSIINDNARAAARGGPGAVMGAKRLKAIVVKGGTHGVEIADADLFQEVIKKANELLVEKGAGLRKAGTPGVVALGNEAGFLPTKNFQTSQFPGAGNINAQSLEKYKISDKACFGCTITCSKVHRSDSIYTDGPEYETLFALGSCCGNDDVASIIRLHELCNRYGIDVISAGVTLSFFMELYEKGIVSRKDVDGLDLSWGNSAAQEALLKKMAYREGIGEIIADGSRKAAARIGKGSEYYALHLKGIDLPGYEPTSQYGVALAYSTSSRGACHLRAMIQVQEGFQGTLDRFSFEGKAPIVKDMQDDMALVDSLVMCKFCFRNGFDNSPHPVAPLIKAVTGWDVDGVWARTVGERTYNLERLYNSQAGLGLEEDRLPDRFYKEGILDGRWKDRRLDWAAFQKALQEYYAVRGWDEKGVPTPKTLERLGISDLKRAHE